MSLTFTSGMTMDTEMDAETTTNWAVVRIAGSGGLPTSSIDNAVFKEGAGSMAAKIANTNTDACLLYDYYTDHSSAVLDLSTGNRHVLLWGLCTTIAAMRTQSASGMYVILQSSSETGTTAPTKYAKWYIGGSDTYKGGWIPILWNPMSPPSEAVGGWVIGTDAALTRRIGFGIYRAATPAAASIKAENLFVDAIRYGKPLYTVEGDGTLVASWDEFLTASATNQDGLVEDIGGAHSIASGIRFGTATQANTTTFVSDTGRQIIFRRGTYYLSKTDSASGSSVVASTGVYTFTAINPSTAGFAAGQEITISGFTDPDNNGTKTITALNSTTITVAEITGMATEGSKTGVVETYDADLIDSTNVYTIDALGAATKRTSVTFGSVVGSGDSRQGVLGGTIATSNPATMSWKMDFQTDKTDLSAVKLYGLISNGANGGILLDNDSGTTETVLVSDQFINCGEIDPGTTGSGAEILNCLLINPKGGTTANRGIKFNSTHNIKKLSCITSGTPATQHMTRLATAGTYSVTWNGIIYFGDYSTGTLWHGEASSANGGAVTQTLAITAGSGSNPDTAEFEITGTNITVATSSSVTLSVTVKDEAGLAISGAQVAIFKSSDSTQLMNEDTIGDGTASETVNVVAGTAISVRVRKGTTGETKYIPVDTNQTTTATGLDLTVTLVEDIINSS